MIRMTRLRLAVATLTHAPARRRSKVERVVPRHAVVIRRRLNALTEAMLPLPPDICLRLRRPFSSSVRAGLAYSGEADPPLKQRTRELPHEIPLHPPSPRLRRGRLITSHPSTTSRSRPRIRRGPRPWSRRRPDRRTRRRSCRRGCSCCRRGSCRCYCGRYCWCWARSSAR